MTEPLPPLKPCPFCGSLDVYFAENSDSGDPIWAACNTCSAEGPPIEHTFKGSQDDARQVIAIHWNTRNGDRCASGCWIKAAVKEMNDSLPSGL